jgi:hypothetical protein
MLQHFESVFVVPEEYANASSGDIVREEIDGDTSTSDVVEENDSNSK